jgi:multicomponent Na+:H+ antiporter subunit D
MAERLLASGVTRTVLVAFAFFTVGVCIKMALFPLHIWLPNAYTYAPSVVTTFLAATATKVSVYILLRFVFTVYGRDFAFVQLPLDYLLMPLALTGIFVASIVAVFQRNLKRMLAFSSVAQIGYIVLGISFASETGLTAGIVHLFNHALIKGGMFMAVGCIVWKCGKSDLEDLRGAGKTMPWTMLAWVIGGLGLIGVPLTAGFVSKWFLIGAAMERGWWPVAAAVLLSSLVAVIYVWRVVEVAYFEAPPEEHARVGEAPMSMLLPTWVMIGASVYFGIWTGLSVGTARRAAELLMGSLP